MRPRVVDVILGVLVLLAAVTVGVRAYERAHAPVCVEWTRGPLHAERECTRWQGGECTRFEDLMEAESTCARWREP